MTANVKVEIAKRTDVLRVPNASLRFRPTMELFAALNQPVPPDVQFGGNRGGRGGQGRSTQGTSGAQAAPGANAPEQATATRAKKNDANAPAAPALRAKYGTAASAQTIDALFAPLPVVESRGRAWVFMNHELKPVNLRLGISDGTNTEVLGGELQPPAEVVTAVTGLGSTRTVPGQTGTGNPLMPGNRPGGLGGPGGRGR
jgi:HlyD family secretion protein